MGRITEGQPKFVNNLTANGGNANVTIVPFSNNSRTIYLSIYPMPQHIYRWLMGKLFAALASATFLDRRKGS